MTKSRKNTFAKKALILKKDFATGTHTKKNFQRCNAILRNASLKAPRMRKKVCEHLK
jgi:hypothetical protein